ncbi:hypothetical protein D0T85_03485 [Bacteroides sp. 519]|nr:hypothetical protein [Bacteroides sp. 519]
MTKNKQILAIADKNFNLILPLYYLQAAKIGTFLSKLNIKPKFYIKLWIMPDIFTKVFFY